MIRTQSRPLIQDLTTLFELGSSVSQTDARLLERFLTHRDEAAFAVIVARHGPLVMGICRRTLVDPHKAADAYQNTFLLLAEKAARVVVHDSLGRWLAGAAKKVAAREREKARKLARREQVMRCLENRPAPYAFESEQSELRAIVSDELAGLPERYRTAIVLHYIEGMSYEEAAGALDCRVGTVKSRLNRGRERLRARLVRRGLNLSLSAILGFISEDTFAMSVCPSIVPATSAVVSSLGAGATTVGAVAISKGAYSMILIKFAAAAVVGIACVAGGFGGSAMSSNSGRQDAGSLPKQVENRESHPKKPVDDQAKGHVQDVDLDGEIDLYVAQDDRQALKDENERLKKRISDLETKIGQLSANDHRLVKQGLLEVNGFVNARHAVPYTSATNRDAVLTDRPTSSVRVSGDVQRPDTYEITDTKVLDLLVKSAGGFKITPLSPEVLEAVRQLVNVTPDLNTEAHEEFEKSIHQLVGQAHAKSARFKVTLIRPARGQAPEQTLPVNIEAIRNGEDTTNYLLKNGDSIDVEAIRTQHPASNNQKLER